MGAKRRKSKKQSNTSAVYRRQLKRTTFFLDRSLSGKVIAEELRKNGVKVESHSTWFRHNTEDVDWLPWVGEKKWVVLTSDARIGKRPIEIDALLRARVKAFVPIQEQLTAPEIAKILLDAMPEMLQLVADNRFPFIARIHHDHSVNIWRTKPVFSQGDKGRKRYHPPKRKDHERVEITIEASGKEER